MAWDQPPTAQPWGGEVLPGDYRSFIRAASLARAPLIGGDPSVAQSSGSAGSGRSGGYDGQALSRRPAGGAEADRGPGRSRAIVVLCRRLFGAFAAALGLVPGVQSHQGEAAVRLECLAMQVMEAVPPYRMTLGAVVDTGPLFRAWATDLAKGVSPDTLAARFRADVAQVFAATARDHPHSGHRGPWPCLAGAFRTPRCLQ